MRSRESAQHSVPSVRVHGGGATPRTSSAYPVGCVTSVPCPSMLLERQKAETKLKVESAKPVAMRLMMGAAGRETRSAADFTT